MLPQDTTKHIVSLPGNLAIVFEIFYFVVQPRVRSIIHFMKIIGSQLDNSQLPGVHGD